MNARKVLSSPLESIPGQRSQLPCRNTSTTPTRAHAAGMSAPPSVEEIATTP
jgi:hypothetical protein